MSNRTDKRENIFKIVTTLGYIGNIILVIAFSIMLIACVINGKALLESVSLDQFVGKIVFVYAFFSGIMVLLGIFSIIGLRRMQKGIKRGFLFYVIPNSIWVLNLFYASEGSVTFIVLAVVSVMFIIYYVFYQQGLE